MNNLNPNASGVQMTNFCPELDAIYCGVVNLSQELKIYGEKLESSTIQEEQTHSFEIAESTIKLLESAVKSLYFDEYERSLRNKSNSNKS